MPYLLIASKDYKLLNVLAEEYVIIQWTERRAAASCFVHCPLYGVSQILEYSFSGSLYIRLQLNLLKVVK